VKLRKILLSVLAALLAALSASIPAAGSEPSSSNPAVRILAGPLVAISRATGKLMTGFPQVSGVGNSGLGSEPYVVAIADDGADGWYIGGNFRKVAGVVCPNLTHIRRDLSVDAGWCPHPDGEVHALLRVGSTLYIGLDYTRRVAGAKRFGLAAFDTRTGRLTDWAPQAASGSDFGNVYQLAANRSGSLLYVSGLFNTVGGRARSNFAAVSASTGLATEFAPNPDADSHGDSLSVFALTATRVYAWGFYSRIGGRHVKAGVLRWYADVLDPRSGKAVASRPMSNDLAREALAVGERVIVSGGFTRLDGKPREGLGSFDARSGTVDTWNPRTGATPARVRAIARSGDVLFATVGVAPETLEGYDLRTGRTVWRSNVRLGPVATMAASRTTLVLGG